MFHSGIQNSRRYRIHHCSFVQSCVPELLHVCSQVQQLFGASSTLTKCHIAKSRIYSSGVRYRPEDSHWTFLLFRLLHLDCGWREHVPTAQDGIDPLIVTEFRPVAILWEARRLRPSVTRLHDHWASIVIGS